MKLNKEALKMKLKRLLKLIFNPKLLLCLGIAWMITNGWCYLFTFFGVYFEINWMAAVGAAYAGLLWLPFTPEKILTVLIAIGLLQLLFPQDKNTLAVLKEELRNAKEATKKLFSKNKKVNNE